MSHCGRVVLVGKTNSGKSSLLNSIVERKISATTKRPQTTRSLIYGVVTQGDRQAICIDTPGTQDDQRTLLNRLMHRQMLQGSAQADIIVWVIDAYREYNKHPPLPKLLTTYKTPLVIALNKIDLLASQQLLLPLASHLQQQATAAQLELIGIFPISALKRKGLEPLKQHIMAQLPPAPFAYDDHQQVLNSERFFACEFLREQLFRQLHKELPFLLSVVCDQLYYKNQILFISLTILITKPSHRAILLGHQGRKMKQMATLARKAMEGFFVNKVMLKVRIKVDKNWNRNPQRLSETILDQEVAKLDS